MQEQLIQVIEKQKTNDKTYIEPEFNGWRQINNNEKYSKLSSFIQRSTDNLCETERQRDRETERQRDRETERQRDRETERQRDRNKAKYRDRERQKDMKQKTTGRPKKHKQANKKQTKGKKDIKTEKLIWRKWTIEVGWKKRPVRKG